MVIHARNFVTSDDALGGSIIEKSCRFDIGTANVSSGSFFTRTFANGNKRTFTISVWFKKFHRVGQTVGEDNYTIISCGGGGTGSYAGRFGLDAYSADQLQFVINNPAPTQHARARSTRVFRDENAWYHAVLAYDSTQATESDRMKMYINGELETMDSPTYPSLNYEGYFNNNVLHRVGSTSSWSTGQDLGQFNGNLAEFHFIDGTAYDASYFGYTDFQTGMWKPKRFDKSNIPNRKGRTFSGSGWTVSGGSGFSGSKPITNAYNGSIGTSNSDVANNSAGGAFLTWDTSAYNLTGNLRIFCWSDGGEYDIYVNGNSGSTTKVGDTPSGSGNAAWIDCGTHANINEIQLSGTTYNTDTGLGSSGVYIAGFMVNGTLLRDDMSEYGTNGFYLDFKDNTSDTTIGYDKSGNANNFSPHDVEVNDVVEDSPTNNWCTLSTILTDTRSDSDFRKGCLTVTTGSGASTVGNSIAVGSGKWYAEFKCTAKSSTNMMIGVQSNYGFDGERQINETQNGGRGYGYINNGNKALTDGSNPSYGATWDIDDVMGIALDMDRFKVNFSKNGAWQGEFDIEDVYGGQPLSYHMCCGHGQGGVTATFEANFGQRAFSYTPPSYHKAINQLNLSLSKSESHTIIVRPQKHFDTLLYTGTGSSNSVTGLEFTPDLIWAKRRDTDGHHHLWVDTIRGGSKSLQSNTNDAENSNANRDMTFLKDGIRWNSNTGNANANGGTYVVWCWKAGGAAVSNGNGNITSSVSVNDEAGFSIVSYTGNGSNGQTVGHGLSRAPQWIILKNRDATQNWRVWQEKLAPDGSKRLILDQTNQNEDASFLNDTAPTSTVFTLGNADDAWNANGDKFIAYCWHEVPGFSKFGRYTGNGSSDGPYVNLGFRPAWTMIKSTSATWNWVMQDTKRFDGLNTGATNRNLAANSDSAEPSSASFSGNEIDYLSNGFKLRSTAANTNASGTEYVYFAFAEQSGFTPFDTSTNAK